MMSLHENGIHAPTGLRWLYVDFNSYFASVEQQMNPALRGKPVAVVPVATDSTCAIAASYEAKAFGVKTGTPIYEARRLCPELVCVLARHSRYVEFHERLLEEINRHIEITKVCSIDEVACQLMRNEYAPDRAEQIAHAIKAGIRENIGEYIRCSIGIAPSQYLAKVATDMKKPDGLTILQPHDLPHRLTSLSLRDLPGIGANIERRLKQAGIHTMSDLLRLQPKYMRSLWHNLWGERMWYYLRRYDLPDEESVRSSIGHSHVLSPEMRTPKNARIIARRLTMKTAARLRRLGYHAGKLHLSVRIENGPKIRLESCCPASQDSFLFLDLLAHMWREVEQVGGMRTIKKIGIVMDNLTADADLGQQGDLFASPSRPAAPPRNERVMAAIDALNHKFGRDTVLLGLIPGQDKAGTDTKIAFTRIPDQEEFLE